MNDRGSNGTGSWRIKVWPYTAKLTNVIVTSFGESSNLVNESKMFVKDEAKVSSRVGGVELKATRSDVDYEKQFASLYAKGLG